MAGRNAECKTTVPCILAAGRHTSNEAQKKIRRDRNLRARIRAVPRAGIWKFGNPVILDHKINPPSTLSEFWNDAWPTHWANRILLPLALVGALLLDSNGGATLLGAGWWGTAATKIALAAAVVVVRLATSFRNPNRGCRFDRSDALAIFRLRDVLFYRRACIEPGNCVALAVGWRSGSVRVLPRAGGGSAACGISTKPPDAGGRRARWLDECVAGNAARNETRASRHHYQRHGCGESGVSQKICARTGAWARWFIPTRWRARFCCCCPCH